MIKATGRHFSDFLESVNNIHLQMRFTYHKMKSPSMYISHVDKEGVVLVYRSSRRGFTQYVMGTWFMKEKGRMLCVRCWCVPDHYDRTC